MNFKSETAFKISNNIVFRKQPDGNYILLEIDGDLLFNLNEVSAFIWNLLSSDHNYGSILAELNEEYEDVGDNEIEEVNLFISELIKMKILTVL